MVDDLTKLRKVFKSYTDDVKAFIVLIDDAMRLSDGVARGKRIAELTNKLQFKNDSVRRFVLDLNFNGRPLKRKSGALLGNSSLHRGSQGAS